MEISLTQYLISYSAILIYFYLLGAGYRQGLLTRLPFFYLYIGWFLVSSISRWIVIWKWGFSSDAYFLFYYISSLLDPLLQVLLLVRIYYLVKSERDKGHWLVLTLFTAMMAYYVMHQPGSNLFVHFHTISLYFQVLFCTLVHIQLQRNRQVLLGRNYEGILYGLTVMIMSMSMAYGMRLFEYLPGTYFLLLMQALAFTPLIIYVFHLRAADLPRRIDPRVVHEIDVAEASLKRALRGLR